VLVQRSAACNAGALAAYSCTRFSPNRVSPSPAASAIVSAGPRLRDSHQLHFVAPRPARRRPLQSPLPAVPGSPLASSLRARPHFTSPFNLDQLSNSLHPSAFNFTCGPSFFSPSPTLHDLCLVRHLRFRQESCGRSSSSVGALLSSSTASSAGQPIGADRFSPVQLKVIQEVITLIVSASLSLLLRPASALEHAVSALFLVGEVFFAFHHSGVEPLPADPACDARASAFQAAPLRSRVRSPEPGRTAACWRRWLVLAGCQV